ncbi:MAG: helix-turn-helix transcriptional regulator [Comamonadaceae bacterium]|nr:helix-turn-helix transcriptional regulator [Comamonadaceae bacterium]
MAELEKAFGSALREMRNQRALSQEALAFEAELARNYISQLELGSKSPSLRTIFKLCKVLETSPTAMIEDVERRIDTPKKTRATPVR